VFFSTIIPTVGRESLSRSVESVLEQKYPQDEFEVIVVNDSGFQLPEQDWQHSPNIKILETNRTERSVARNTGAAIAKGKYLHFLDDDDWILPDAFANFYRGYRRNPAAWIYGSTQLVDRQGRGLILLKHFMEGNLFVQVMAGEWIPLQSSIIDRKAFRRIGGFQQRMSATEDVDLARRFALHYGFTCIPEVVSFIGMGEENSTSHHKIAHYYGRQAREWILEEKGVFSRLLDSADSSEWRGKIPRIYLTSMLWNIQRYRFTTAFSRALFAQFSLVLAGSSILTTSFWKSLFYQYNSVTFARGFQEAAARDIGSTV
jgi:glycosyltransferase involved in cell wall biosynthesis